MEDLDYKHKDYLYRSNDKYALVKYDIVMEYLPKRDNLQILNAGCGSGEMNVLLAQNKSWQITGIDNDEKSISLSQKLKEEFKLDNLLLFRSAIEEFEPKEKYDIIIANDVLEHIEDDKEALSKLSLMLKKDGIICISVPALNLLFGYHDIMLGHYRRYNKKNLKKLFSLFFEIHKCRYFGFILIPVAFFFSRIIKKSYPVYKVSKLSIFSKLINLILSIEKAYSLPLGTSLIALGKLKK